TSDSDSSKGDVVGRAGCVGWALLSRFLGPLPFWASAALSSASRSISSVSIGSPEPGGAPRSLLGERGGGLSGGGSLAGPLLGGLACLPRETVESGAASGMRTLLSASPSSGTICTPLSRRDLLLPVLRLGGVAAGADGACGSSTILTSLSLAIW